DPRAVAVMPLARLAAARVQLAGGEAARGDGRDARRADFVDAVAERLDVLQVAVAEAEPLHEAGRTEVVVPDGPVHLALFLDGSAGAEDFHGGKIVGPERAAARAAHLRLEHAGADDARSAAQAERPGSARCAQQQGCDSEAQETTNRSVHAVSLM